MSFVLLARMLIISGTKRSGTSLLMQALHHVGYSIIGSKYPSDWEMSIRDANPNGFWESPYRTGINWTSNPKNGVYLTAASSKNHAIKIFLPGLVQTEIAFIDKVVVTVRHWSSYTNSMKKLDDLENTYIRHLADPDKKAEKQTQRQIVELSSYPHEVEWFFENMSFLQDYTARKYPVQMTSYESLVQNPEKEFDTIFKFLGFGHATRAIEVIQPSLQRNQVCLAMKHPYSEVFDDFYTALSSSTVPASLLPTLNKTAEKLRREYAK